MSALPDKTDAIDSYDPSTAIKINVRIHDQSYDVEIPMTRWAAPGGLGGTTSTETVSTGSMSLSASMSSSGSMSTSGSMSSSSTN